eukprot:8612826-Pyramimonas_sp.AAC.1
MFQEEERCSSNIKSQCVKTRQTQPGCPQNISCKPKKVLRTFFGGPVGEPGRFASPLLETWRPNFSGACF